MPEEEKNIYEMEARGAKARPITAIIDKARAYKNGLNSDLVKLAQSMGVADIAQATKEKLDAYYGADIGDATTDINTLKTLKGIKDFMETETGELPKNNRAA